ncbi:MAG: trypsin-like peptidase domain-containing protein [Xenococcaceae cyanobacterium MO_188.B19]|nr:trypsin-like peptidase domain-containing protein [Xenococcaceae cyanobacterium MO_188.B19]
MNQLFEIFKKILNAIGIRNINLQKGQYNENFRDYIAKQEIININNNNGKSKYFNWEEIQSSVVLITSSNPEIENFGTGFVINQSGSTSYVLTCANVVKNVGGSEQLIVNKKNAVQIASGEKDNLNLAVLKVDDLFHKLPLELQPCDEKGIAFCAIGFQSFEQGHIIRPVDGILGEQLGLQFGNSDKPIKAWELNLTKGVSLQPSFSGSPVIDHQSGCVLGIISYQDEKGSKGMAISIDSLDKIWKLRNRDELYKVLLKLGYEDQASAFLKLVQAQSVSSFLIHGSPDYGQRWLLNRLVEQYVPNNIDPMVVKIDFGRKIRRNDINSLWRELGIRVGLQTNKPVPSEIIERVYQSWKAKTILLVFHDVDRIPENYLYELIASFWRPLADRIRKEEYKAKNYHLIMFLIDYEGKVGSLNDIFTDSVDAKKLETPVKSPKINEFSEKDLSNWIRYEYQELPIELTHEVDDVVKDILKQSESGIPEYVLAEICYRCGLDWYKEFEEQMRY